MPHHLYDPPNPSRRTRALGWWSKISTVVSWAVIAVLVIVGAVHWLGVFSDWVNREEPAAAAPAAPQWPVATPTETGFTPGDGTFLDPSEVDRTDPGEVARAAALLMVSHDTATDDTTTDATLRARDLMAPEVAEAVTEPERGSLLEDWLTAADHRAYTSPAATAVTIPSLEHAHEGEHEEPVVTSATGETVEPYEFQVVYQWHPRTPWTMEDPPPEGTRVVQLSVAERDGQWMVVEHYTGTPAISDYAAE